MPMPHPVWTEYRGPTPTVLVSWIRVLLDAFRDRGGDVGALLQAAGFPEHILNEPSARHPMRDVVRLWQLAADMTGDASFGLVVPKYIHATTFHALGFAVLASPTLREALERMVRYAQVVTDSGLLRLEMHNEESELHIIPFVSVGGSDALSDSVLSMVVRALRLLTGGTFRLNSVALRRTGSLAPYERFFRCDIRGGAHDELRFDTMMLDTRLASSNPELANHNDHAVRDYLLRVAPGTLADRARTVIGELNPRDATSARVARKLGMGLRSMQRALHEQGTCYEALMDDVRRELACAYLVAAEPIGEIAFLLGYQSPSTFARAFKRWTGRSPREYCLERGIGLKPLPR